MVHGAVRSLFQLLGVLVVGLLIAIPVLAWRLSNGPIRLDFLSPYIEEALTAPDGSFRAELEGTVLALGEGSRMVEVRARGVKAFAGGSQPVATLPELALTLNGRALMRGELAPNSIRLYGPRLRLVRDAEGRLLLGVGDQPDEGGDEDAVRRILDALVGEPDPSRPGRHLQRAAIVDAELVVDDLKLGTQWRAPDVDLGLTRTPQGLAVEGAAVVEAGGERGLVSARLDYARAGERLAGQLRVENIRPAVFARLGGAATPLAAIDLPLSGSVSLAGDIHGNIAELSFDMAGGEGRLVLPEPANINHPVAAAHLKGRLTDGLKRAELEEFYLDLGGPTLTLAAVADGLGGASAVKGDVVLRNVPFDQLKHLWPAVAAPNPREWVLSNLSKGMVHEARATLSGRSASGNFDDLVVEHLSGTLAGDGVTVDYLHPMPPVKNGVAQVSFDASDFRISVKGGEVYGLKLRDGLIVLSGLDKEDQFADIELLVSGPAADALRLIDNKPLGYAKALGIDPAGVGGEATTRLKLKFPLLKDLKLDDLSVKAHASLKKASVPKVVMGLDLSGADLEIDVDAKGLDASGPVVLGGIPARLEWRENFSVKGVAYRSRYHLVAPRVDEDQRRLLGLDGPPFVAPFTEGPVGATVVATLYGGGRGDIEAKVDLGPARMTLPGLGWKKEPNTLGAADVLVRLEKMKLAGVPHFEVNASDLTARGSVAFTSEGSARRVEFDKLSYGRTDLAGSITFRPEKGGMDIAARGRSFDAEPVLATSDEEKARRADGRPKPKDDLPPMAITAAVQSLWVSGKGNLSNASISLSRNADDWRSLSLKAGVGEGKSFAVVMQPGTPQRRNIRIDSDDAGAVMRAFDVYDDLMGGKLEVDGYYDDTKPDQPIIGKVRISDYHVVNAPALARLVTVVGLTGILDLLGGQGVGFSTLDAPFVLTEGLLKVSEVRAYGPALGITAKGELDMDRSQMALEGTVVPAYALNSVLGNIPVLGWLVTGGEKGGGLVAFNYTMKGPTEDPSVLVNPLSALTPGFLRNLFNIFDDGSETEARKKRPAQ